MTDKTSDYSNDQKLRVKQFLLALLYFPFQLAIFLCIYPFAAVVMACSAWVKDKFPSPRYYEET